MGLANCSLFPHPPAVAPVAPTPANRPAGSRVALCAAEVMATVLAQLPELGAAHVDDARRAAVTRQVEFIVNQLQNEAYTEGYFAGTSDVRTKILL